MKTVAFIQVGHSQYDDRLWSLLGTAELRPTRDEAFASLDHFEYLPYLVLAGASIEADPEFPDLHTVRVTVPEDREEAFYAELGNLLS